MPVARHSRRRAVSVFWSAAQDRRLIELHERRDMTSDQIAHELSVTLRSLKYRTEELRRRGWTVPYPVRLNCVWTPARDARLIALRSDGKDKDDIARALGTTRAAIHSRLAKLVPLTPRVQHRWTPDCEATLVRMRGEGQRANVIAAAIGVTTVAVYARSVKLGVVKSWRAA